MLIWIVPFFFKDDVHVIELKLWECEIVWYTKVTSFAASINVLSSTIKGVK